MNSKTIDLKLNMTKRSTEIKFWTICETKRKCCTLNSKIAWFVCAIHWIEIFYTIENFALEFYRIFTSQFARTTIPLHFGHSTLCFAIWNVARCLNEPCASFAPTYFVLKSHFSVHSIAFKSMFVLKNRYHWQNVHHANYLENMRMFDVRNMQFRALNEFKPFELKESESFIPTKCHLWNKQKHFLNF